MEVPDLRPAGRVSARSSGEVSQVVVKVVAVRGHPTRVAKADEVGSNTSSYRGNMRDYIAIQIGGRRVAMKEDNYWCLCIWQACVNVGHCRIEHEHVVLCERKIGRYCVGDHRERSGQGTTDRLRKR